MPSDLEHRHRDIPLACAIGEALADRQRLAGGAAALDEWHCRAAEATAELGAMAGLRTGMRVLDVGCGVGGAARHLATNHDVSVIGIDRCRLYVQVAQLLTKQAACRARVRFDCTHAESAPFAISSFECVWLQHVLLHIHDKARVFAELRRMLVPGGVLALHEIVAPRGGRIPLPLPWATSAARSFVPRPERLRIALESAGFVLTTWHDTTPAARDWCARLLARADADHPLIAPGSVSAMRNFAEAMAKGTLGVAMAVFHKPE